METAPVEGQGVSAVLDRVFGGDLDGGGGTFSYVAARRRGAVS